MIGWMFDMIAYAIGGCMAIAYTWCVLAGIYGTIADGVKYLYKTIADWMK